MPTETTKLGGLLTALSNLCDDPPPPSPDKTYSDNLVQVVTTDKARAAVAPPPVIGATTPFAPPQPTTALTESIVTSTSLPTNNSNFGNIQRSSKYKPAPPPYPPPGYYANKEKFLDSDSYADEDSDDDDDEDDDQVQYFDSFESSDDFDGTSSQRTYSGGRGSMLPTRKNARARARSLPSKLRPMPDDPPTRKYNKRKKSSTVSTARPKLGGGGISTKKSSSSSKKYAKSEAIQFPTPEDILAGRGGGTNRHDGNIRFRDEARKLRIIYKDNQTDRRTKFMLSQELVTRVRQYGGRFLEKGHDGRWYEMDEMSARKKASQVLREEKWE